MSRGVMVPIPAPAPAATARSRPTGTEAPATAKTPAASMLHARGDVPCHEPFHHRRRLAGLQQKSEALAPLLLLVGLLTGIALAFGYGQFMDEETPTTTLEDQVVKLRKQSADRFEDQLNGHFWLRQCSQHSPLCAGYIAGFTRMNSTLAHRSSASATCASPRSRASSQR